MTHSTTVGTAPELWQRCGPLRVKEKLSPASSRNNLPSTDKMGEPWYDDIETSRIKTKVLPGGGSVRGQGQGLLDPDPGAGHATVAETGLGQAFGEGLQVRLQAIDVFFEAATGFVATAFGQE